MPDSLEVVPRPLLQPRGVHVLNRISGDRGVAYNSITAAIGSGRPMGIVRARAEAWLREVFLPKALARCDNPDGEGAHYIEKLWQSHEALAAGHTDLNTTEGIAMAMEEIISAVLDLTPEAGKPALRVALFELALVLNKRRFSAP